MAQTESKVIITAVDRSKAAFAAVQGRLKRLSGQVLSARTAIAALVGVGGFGLLIKQSFSANDALAKMGNRLNIATDQLGGLHHAASLTGVPVNTFNMAMQRMSRRVGEAANETGEAIAAIKELGLDATRLAQMKPDQAFLEITDALNGVENQTEKLRLAFKLFDSEGVALLQTMGAGRETIEAFMLEARRLGIALNDIETAKIEAANDAMTRLRGVFRGAGNIIALELAGPIKTVADNFTEAAAGSDEFRNKIREMTREALHGIVSVVRGLASIVGFIDRFPEIAQFGLIGYVLFGKKGALIGSTIGFVFNQVRREMAKLGVGADENVAKLLKLEDQLAGVNELLAIPEAKRIEMHYGGVGLKTEELREKQAKLTEQINALKASMTDAAWEQFRKQWGQLPGDASNLQQLMLKFAEDLEKSIGKPFEIPVKPKIEEPVRDGFDPNSQAVKDAAVKIQETYRSRLAMIEESFMTEREQLQMHFQQQLSIIEGAEALKFISAEKSARLRENLELHHQAKLGNIHAQAVLARRKFEEKNSREKTKHVMSDLETLTASVATNSKTMFRLNKIAGIANAIINTHEGVTKALSAYPPPLSFAMAGAQLAAGMAQVSAIKSATFGSATSAPSVGGGAATPVTPVEGIGTQRDRDVPRMVHVDVRLHGDESEKKYSKRDIREILEGLQEEIGDDAAISSLRVI